MADLRKICIANGEMSANLLDFGASLVELRINGHPQSMVLGYRDPQDYLGNSQFLGAVIGRYANRIAGGRAMLNAQELQLERNEEGVGQLHGGTPGYGTRIWNISDHGETSAVFTLYSPDGEAGFPGNLSAEAIYELSSPNTLRLTLKAISDKDTLVNLCHHPYFNLAGEGEVTGHKLEINATHVLPSHENLIPTGAIAAVARTEFDYRRARSVQSQQINNTFCLHDQPCGDLRHAATLTHEARIMEVWTTQPGLHVYNGYKLKPGALGHAGKKLHPLEGVCLEAQAWPDSPNRASFPSVELKAGETYQQITEYRFF